MRSTYYPGVCTKPSTYLLSGLVYVHEVYTGTEWGVLTIQKYVLNQVLTIRVGLCTWGIHRDRMRSTYYPGVCTKPSTYYQGWFMYMRYTQGQNGEYSMYCPGLWTKPGTYVHTKQVPLYIKQCHTMYIYGQRITAWGTETSNLFYFGSGHVGVSVSFLKLLPRRVKLLTALVVLLFQLWVGWT